MNGIYCINMASLPCRRDFMEQQFKSQNILNYEFVNAVRFDDKQVLDAIFDRQVIPHRLRTCSQIAISFSHLKCWQYILDRKQCYGCIIEDDIRLVPSCFDKFKNALTFEISDKFLKQPMLLCLTGLKSIKMIDNLAETPKFVDIGCQYSNCMYVINYQMAKILIDNFLPITMPSDDYIIKTCRHLGIKQLSLLPVIAYDLSSNYYNKLWTADDIAQKQKFTRLSVIAPLSTQLQKNEFMNRKYKLPDGDSILTNFTNMLFGGHKASYVTSKFYKEAHFLISGNSVRSHMVNNNSIICGAGVNNLEDYINKPMYISSVRGPITRNRLLELGIFCRPSYGDPLLLTSKIIKKNILKHFKLCIYGNAKVNAFITGRLKSFGLKDFMCFTPESNFNEVINTITRSEYVLTNSLPILIMAHSYGIKGIWFDIGSHGLSFMDYYGSLDMHKISPFNLIYHTNLGKQHLLGLLNVFPQPHPKNIKKLQDNIIATLPFIHDLSGI